MATTANPGELDVQNVLHDQLGLICDVGLGVPKRREFRADADRPLEECEIDFLVPFGEYCIVGEHTDLASRQDVKTHIRKLTQKIEFLETVDPNQRFAPFTIATTHRRHYRDVRTLIGCFIYSNEIHQREIEASGARMLALSPRKWGLVKHYGECVGRYAKFHFLDTVGIPISYLAQQSTSGRPESRRIPPGKYIALSSKKISPHYDEANVFVFAMDPETLLPISRVLRRDNLPALVDPNSPAGSVPYQRVLIKSKLAEIADLLSAVGADFTHPTAVLALMSQSCTLDSTTHELNIPKEFGTLEIIDGQHRLFAYAGDSVTSSIRNDAEILVIGIQFINTNAADAQSWASDMFIEINTKQTRVQQDHQLIVGYYLGKTDPRHLAAGMLVSLNQDGVLEAKLKVDSTSPPDAINITTIVTKAKDLFRLDDYRSWSLRDQRLWLTLTGQDPSILDAGRESEYVHVVANVARRFFAKVKSTFREDWDAPKESSLMSAKYFAALCAILEYLMDKGYSWEKVDRWLARTKSRSLRESSIEFRRKRLAFAADEVPSTKNSVAQITEHLMACGSWRRG